MFNRSDSVSFAGTIAGGGTLTQNGNVTGTLILNGGSGGFAGSTTVASGTLEVGDASHTSASLGGNVSVNPARR